MSALTRYPVPQGTAAGKVDGPRIVLPARHPPSGNFASRFDGTNDHLNRGANLTGVSDGKLGVISFWYHSDDDGSPRQTIIDASSGAGVILRLEKLTGDLLEIDIFDRSGPTTLLALTTLTTVKVEDGWSHFLISWDFNAASSRAQLFVNDVDDGDIVSGPTDANADYSNATEWTVGARTDTTNKLNGCISQFYFNLGLDLDISVEANRRLFINANLTPVDLRSDGSNPTGAAPIVYLGKIAANFHLNGGTGGDFTQNGTLIGCPPPHGTVTLQPLRGLEFIEAGAVDDPRLHFRLESTIVPAPVLDFLQPLRATKQGIAAGAVADPRLYFRLTAAAAATNRLLLINPPGLDGGFGVGLAL